MVSLMSDSRVAFLIWFISVAIIVAAVLIFIEIRLKRKQVRDASMIQEKTPIDRMNIFLAGGASAREKLDAVGRTAKNYFKEEYGLLDKLDYGELAKEFEKRDKVLEVKFCEEMFEAYYSNHELTSEKIDNLGIMLSEVCRRKNVSVAVSRVPGWGDRFDRFMEDIRIAIVSRIEKHVKIRSERLERDARIAARQEHELYNWVRKAIYMGYDKMKIFSLLSDGKRNRREVKKVLKIYDKEAVNFAKKKISIQDYSSEGGIAQKIIQKEKDRLEESETYAR